MDPVRNGGAVAGSTSGWTDCAVCARRLPPDSRYCSGCGIPLRGDAPGHAPGSDAEDEFGPWRLTARSRHGPVTILFVNVHGSLDLSATLESEVWHGVISRFLAILTRVVVAHGGVVDRFTGTGIKASFGAPIAHENHARQACEAALDLAAELRDFGQHLRRTLGINFSTRMGLNSGEALCGPIGVPDLATYSAQGHTAGLAARMEQLAEPGRIYVTEATASLVGHAFRFHDLGPFSIRGVNDSLRVYELAAAVDQRSRPTASRNRSFTTFVGRDAEIERLEAALDRAVRGERPETVGIEGEAGIGKSRLCDEFVARCRSRGILALRIPAVESERGIPFRTGHRLVRALFDVKPEDTSQAVREKIAGRLLLLDPELRDVLDIAFDLVGVAESRGSGADFSTRVDLLARLLGRLIEAQNRRAPAVFLFDDRHWIDSASEAICQVLYSSALRTRTLILMNYRPGYRRPWMEHANFEEIRLKPLRDAFVDEILRNTLGSDPSLSALVERIRLRAGGNPFFTEEILRSLIRSGALAGTTGNYRLVRGGTENDLPASLHAVLAARLELLRPADRLLLESAAVIGSRFSESVLHAVGGTTATGLHEALERLSDENLLDQAPGPDSEGWRFRHVLMQEAAYRSILRPRRARLHARVAAAMAAGVAPETGPTASASLIAQHWERGGNLLEAARWSERAAHYAASRDPDRGLENWRRVRESVSRLPETPEALDLALSAHLGELRLAFHQGMAPEDAANLYAAGRRIAETLGDERRLALLVAAYADLRDLGGANAEAIELGDEALALAGRLGDESLRLALRSRQSIALYHSGRLLETLALCEQTGPPSPEREIARGLVGFVPSVGMSLLRGVTLLDLGKLEEGRKALESVIERIRESGDEAALASAIAAYAAVPRLSGEMPPDLLSLSHEAVEIADRLGSHYLRVVTRSTLGATQMHAGRYSDAVATLNDALGLLESRAASFHVDASILSILATLCITGGDRVRGLEFANRARRAVDGRGMRIWEIDTLIRWSYVAAVCRTESLERLEEELDRALELVAATGCHSRSPIVFAMKSIVLREFGELHRSIVALERARDAARTIRADHHVARLDQEIAQSKLRIEESGRSGQPAALVT